VSPTLAPMRHLLASDLDGTLIPRNDGPEARRAVAAFRRALEGRGPDRILAYVTGRHLALALEGVAAAGLPLPDCFACDVGTSVLWREGEGWSADPDFEAEMRRAMGGADADDARRALAGTRLELQEAAKQAPFKASFYLPWEERARMEDEARRRLADAGVGGSLVWSRDVLDGRGLLDVLPEGGAKDRAVRHLAARLTIPHERVAFAGDSGNDRAALLGGWGAVLVGNAPEALKEEIRAEAERRGLEDRVYVARAPCAAGVLEGFEALGYRLR